MTLKNNPFNVKPKDEFNVEEWIDFLAERYGWTVPEIMDLPIPTFFALQTAINKRIERENKAMKTK